MFHLYEHIFFFQIHHIFYNIKPFNFCRLDSRYEQQLNEHAREKKIKKLMNIILIWIQK
jgi:hypothetical protein